MAWTVRLSDEIPRSISQQIRFLRKCIRCSALPPLVIEGAVELLHRLSEESKARHLGIAFNSPDNTAWLVRLNVRTPNNLLSESRVVSEAEMEGAVNRARSLSRHSYHLLLAVSPARDSPQITGLFAPLRSDRDRLQTPTTFERQLASALQGLASP